MENSLIHVVLISFREGVPEAERQEIYRMYQDIAERCGGRDAGILFWKVGWNLDLRKGVHLVELAVFNSQEALQKFRVHPEHGKLTEKLKLIADWKVGDVTECFSLLGPS